VFRVEGLIDGVSMGASRMCFEVKTHRQSIDGRTSAVFRDEAHIGGVSMRGPWLCFKVKASSAEYQWHLNYVSM